MLNSTNKLSIFYSNINGLVSKTDSLAHILQSTSPDVVVICELKTKSVPSVKNFFDKLNYSAIVCIESGIAIAAKKKYKIVNVTASGHSNIISGRFLSGATPFRVIAPYGLQETAPADERAHFFDELSVELESAMLNPENLLIIFDLNA